MSTDCESLQLLADGKARCSACKDVLPVALFNKDRHTVHGLARYCRPCNKTKCSRRYLNNKASHRDGHLRHDFGISSEEYDSMHASRVADVPSAAKSRAAADWR